MSYAAKRPDIEITRRIRRGPYQGATRSYATVYRKPLAVWVLGRWLIGGRRVRAQWRKVEREEMLATVALLDELADVLAEVTRYPHRSHPGRPAVSYQHLNAELHDRAKAVLLRAAEHANEHHPDGSTRDPASARLSNKDAAT